MTLPFRSLRSRILALVAIPLVLLVGALLLISHRATTATVEASAQERLGNAASVLREMVESRRAALLAQARVTAADPRFFATFSVPEEERGEEFVHTMRLVARDFLQITDADFIEVRDQRGLPLFREDRDGRVPENWAELGSASIGVALRRAASTDLFIVPEGAVLVADAPVFLGRRQEAVLRMGLDLDADFAHEVRRLTGSELAIGGKDGFAVATWTELPSGSVAPDAGVVRLAAGEGEFLCLAAEFAGLGPDSGFTALVGRSTGEELAALRRAERLMGTIGVLALLAAVVAGIWIAVGVTRPLHELVGFARRIREGDYSRPVPRFGRDEVGLLAHSLEESRQALQAHVHRLEELDRRRGEFLSLAGHELRTPLTVVTSFNDLIHEGGFGDLPAEVIETTAVIGDQLRHLNDLVTDILDLTGLEAAPDKAVSLQHVDMGPLVDRVNREHELARAGRMVDVRWEFPSGPVGVLGDERLLARAVRALLDNAVRFTPDGGHVDLMLLVHGGEARLSVADDGIGIDPDDLRWIYDKLYEGADIENHSSGRLEFRSGGMGIGLSLTRAVVRAHGGQLRVESEPGRGSCFTIELPAATGPAEDPVPTRNPDSEEVPC